MDRTEAVARVVKVVTETLEVKPEDVIESASYVEDFDADSLDLVELVMAFEDEFEVSIPEESIESIKTIGQTVDFIVANAG